MNRYIIAFLIKGEAEKSHQKLSYQIAKKYRLKRTDTPSHITLKDTFYTDRLTEVKEAISESFASTKDRGEVTMEGISNFKNKIYYIKTDLNDRAFEIHSKLIGALHEIEWLQWDEFDLVDRNFHASITTKANPDNYHEIEEELGTDTPKFVLPFDNIAILRKEEKTKKWMVDWEVGG